jgi:UDP-N-acetylglucosamine acyltransferase
MTVSIHPTALVERGAELGVGVEVGPFCLVSAESRVGDRSKLLSHVVLRGRVKLGIENTLYPYVCIGAEPQDLSYQNEPTSLEIGDRNTFRESFTAHRGTARDRGVTIIGNDNYFMACCHVAHDCVVGNFNQFANYSGLGGHVEIQDNVVIGGITVVVQKCRVGSYAFIGASSVLRRDLPPYMAAKEFSTISGPNVVGLRRRKFPDDELRVISELYKIFYLGHLKTEAALAAIETRFPESPAAKLFMEFVKNTKVGVQR